MAVDYSVGMNQLRDVIIMLRQGGFNQGLTALNRKTSPAVLYNTIRQRMNSNIFEQSDLAILEDTMRKGSDVNINVWKKSSLTLGTDRTRGDVTTGQANVDTVTISTLDGIQTDMSVSFINGWESQRTPEWDGERSLTVNEMEVFNLMWDMGNAITQQIETQVAQQIEASFQDFVTTPLTGYEKFTTYGTEGQKDVSALERKQYFQTMPVEWSANNMDWVQGSQISFATTSFDLLKKDYMADGTYNAKDFNQFVGGEIVTSNYLTLDAGNESQSYVCTPNAFGVFSKVFDGYSRHKLADSDGVVQVANDYWFPVMNLREIDPSFADVNVELKGFVGHADNSASYGGEATNDIVSKLSMYTEIGFHNAYTGRTGETAVWRYDIKA